MLSPLKDVLSDKSKSSASEGKRWDVIENGIKSMSDVSHQMLLPVGLVRAVSFKDPRWHLGG